MMKLLIVDDESGLVRALRRWFRNDFEIFEAGNGQEGLAIALKEQPDVVLSDVQMPRMDGATMAKELRLHGLATPIVLMSGSLGPHAGAVERLIAAGHVHHEVMEKPVDLNRLRSLVTTLAQSPSPSTPA